MDYYPDVWVVVKLSGSKVKKTYYRILAGWYGGFAGSNSWKMNSGITHVNDLGNHYEVFGESGSVYFCNKDSERTSGYTHSVFQSYARQNSDEVSVEIVDSVNVFPELLRSKE